MGRVSPRNAALLGTLLSLAVTPARGASGAELEPGARADVAVFVDLSDSGVRARGARLRVFARTVLAVHVTAEANQEAVWAFAYGDDVLAHGAVRIDAGGHGRLRLVVPKVRTRTVCRLLVRVPAGSEAKEVEVFPSSLLAPAAGRLADLALAAADPTGRLQTALESEKVAFDRLETDIQKLIFGGDVAILAGHRRAGSLAGACRGLEGRLKRGMTLVVLNPPPKWEAWGFCRNTFADPLSGPARLAMGFRQILRPDDLGNGPWSYALRTGADVVPLAWIEQENVQQDAPASRKTVVHTLVGARRVGEGWLVVTMLPRAEDPATDAVGRSILGELLLWAVREHGTGNRKTGNKGDWQCGSDSMS